MSLLSSILLGLIQGLAEFLPISSSGHLAIAEHFLGQAGVPATPDFFDVLLHLGTLVAVFAAYWQDIRDMIVELIDGVRDLVRGTTPNPIPPARRMILLIIVGTLPLFVVLPVKDLVEGLSGNIYFVAGALIVTGFLLFASDRVKKGRKTERSAKLLDVLLVGIAQAIATCPGISRSGTTITAGCFVGFDRKFAVRFSFLLSIPAVLGANILTLKDEEFDNVYHKLRGELSSPTQQLIVHYCRERQIPPEVRRRKVYVVRALILGAAIQFENGELTYGEEALQMVHDCIQQALELA